MTATHLAITVELIGGMHAHELWPRPGRVLVAARRTTFSEFADAIDTAFARWDRAHLHLFTLADGTTIAPLRYWDDPLPGMVDGDRLSLSRLRPGEQFAYAFDLGDNWEHLCTVSEPRARSDHTANLGRQVPQDDDAAQTKDARFVREPYEVSHHPDPMTAGTPRSRRDLAASIGHAAGTTRSRTTERMALGPG